MDQIQNLSHQELLRLIEVYAKKWESWNLVSSQRKSIQESKQNASPAHRMKLLISSVPGNLHYVNN